MGDHKTRMAAANMASEVMAQAAERIYDTSDDPVTKLKNDLIVVAEAIETYVGPDDG